MLTRTRIVGVATAATLMLAPAAVAAPPDQPPGQTCGDQNNSKVPFGRWSEEADQHMTSKKAAHENEGDGGMMKAEPFCDSMM